jgi:hypothetical protein
MKKIILSKQFSFFTIKNALLLIAFCLGSSVDAQTTYTSVSALQTAVNAAASTGGTFILQDGTYSDASFSFTSIQATEDLPIIIKSESVGGVTFTDDSKFTMSKCSHITVQGFVFDCTGTNSLVKLSGCNNIRFTRNDFKLTISDGESSVKWFYIGGVYDDIVYPYTNPSYSNRVDHNNFHDKTLPGHYITIDGNNSSDQSQYDRIDHNYFSNNSPRAVNEQESIRVGWSEMSESSGYTTVDYNLFENCDGDPEVVSIKSCDNIVAHNTFNGNYGTLSFRHGNRNRAEGNYFFGNGREVGLSSDGTTSLYTGGIRVYGKDHVIVNNYFEGLNGTKWDAPITLTQGDVDQTSSSLSSHFRPESIIIAYNTLVNNEHGIELGFSNSGAYTKDMLDITIANNLITGSVNSLVEIIDDNDPGSNVTWSNNLMYPTDSATTLSGGTTTTSFTTSQAVNENPNLVYDADQGTWRSTATTPLYTNTTELTNDEDIDGQTRPDPSNPGADNYSTDLSSVRYMPMTTDTVGPYAYEDDETESDSLWLSTLDSFDAAGESKTTTVTSNVSWTASVDDSSWVTIDNTSGTDSGSITITVDANPDYASRTATLTVVGGSLTRTLTITQDALVSTTAMINAGEAGYPVTVTATQEQVDSTHFNYATNTLDKDTSTKWSDLGTGSSASDYGVLTYDFGGTYTLESIKIATTGTSSKVYYYSIQFSTDGVNYTDAVSVTSAAAGSTTYETYLFTDVARYVKITGAGNSSSAYSSLSEIEFYGDTYLSVNKNEISNQFVVYPNPASSSINVISDEYAIGRALVYSLDGKLLINKKIKDTDSNSFSIDVSSLSMGNYVLQLVDTSYKTQGSKIITIVK